MKPPTFPVHCCDCSEYIAETTCEITATSPYTFCLSCLAQFDAEQDEETDRLNPRTTTLNPKP